MKEKPMSEQEVAELRKKLKELERLQPSEEEVKERIRRLVQKYYRSEGEGDKAI